MDAVTLDQNVYQETTCSICLPFFSKPVTLGHSFCQVCLTRSIDNGVTHFTCPKCRKDSHSLSGLNVSLSKLSAVCPTGFFKFWGLRFLQRYCQKHQQVTKLFCKEDQTSLCISCTEGQEHATHTFSPINSPQNCRKKPQGYCTSFEKEDQGMRGA